MAAKRSAGILLYRGGPADTEVLLGHMGGPFWARKDEAAWSVPKGEHEPDEAPLAAARREFEEELGLPVPEGEHVELGEVRQSGKVVTVFAIEADLDPSLAVPGTFELEWPPRSGKMQEFPEMDRFEWFGLAEAERKLVKGQRPFLGRLAERLT
ncbi:NUDIX domain-containing protein [Amycolatopsis albispora]|uniref:NUDIX hydrolase n=1 Tax=Amycolatopsis albispora TaxID=1804986 RepID=A0A344LJR9_9PSEU|nr:NUDIX domain-containing protein [Amycolatopsis albispora]AXB48293.1 NUDIX hydrolase [Amycolatopsis albispora]